MFFRRGTTGDDPWLAEKLWLFTIGAVVALVGMLLDNGWIIALGAAILAGGIFLRFIPRRGAGDRDGAEGRADGGGGDGPGGPDRYDLDDR